MKLLLALFLLSTVSLPLTAQTKTLTAEADPWPPFVNPKDPTGGLSLEVIRAALQTQGYRIQMTYVPWARALSDVREGIVDILPDTWRIADQATYLAYSEPYATNEVRFIARKSDPFEFDGLESLKGKKIGTVKDYGYQDAFIDSNLFVREEVPDLMTNIRKLLANRIDLTLEDPIVATYIMDVADPGLRAQVRFSKKSLSTVALHLSVGIKNPRAREILAAFNRGLSTIKSNGIYQRLFAKYGIAE